MPSASPVDQALLDSMEVGTFCGVKSVWVRLLPLELLSLPAALGHVPTSVVMDTHPAPFNRPAGFPLLLDTPTTTLGHLPSAPAVSDDIGIEPEVRVKLVESYTAAAVQSRS